MSETQETVTVPKRDLAEVLREVRKIRRKLEEGS